MPINNEQLEELEDATKKTSRSKAIDYLKEHSDEWFYVNELSQEADVARSTVIDALKKNPDMVEEKYKKKDGRKYRFVKYSKDSE